MGSQLRERIFVRLRPRLRIHGSNARGYHFSEKPGHPSPDWWAFKQQGTRLCQWDFASARRDGFAMYGDPELAVYTFSGGFQGWEHFISEALWHASTWFSGEPRCSFRFAPIISRPRWSDLLSNVAEPRHVARILTLAKLPNFQRAMPLLIDGNSTIYLLGGSRLGIMEFCTS